MTHTTNQDYATAPASEVFWRYGVPPRTDQDMCLLTVGGILYRGRWTGYLGEDFIAWSPMMRSNKEEAAKATLFGKLRRLNLERVKLYRMETYGDSPDAIQIQQAIVRARETDPDLRKFISQLDKEDEDVACSDGGGSSLS